MPINGKVLNLRTIEKYVQMLNLDEKQLAKINKFRKLAGMTEI